MAIIIRNVFGECKIIDNPNIFYAVNEDGELLISGDENGDLHLAENPFGECKIIDIPNTSYGLNEDGDLIIVEKSDAIRT